MGLNFEAVCAQLSSAELGAVAASEGVVWGQIKGYPFWPAQVIPSDRANRDGQLREARPAKGGSHVALQFYGDTTKAWVKEDGVMTWAEGCAKGYLKGKQKQKQQAVFQAHEFFNTGVLPEGWWQKSLKEAPFKRAKAAAAAAAKQHKQQQQQEQQRAAKKAKLAEQPASEKKPKAGKAAAENGAAAAAASPQQAAPAVAAPEVAAPAGEPAAAAGSDGASPMDTDSPAASSDEQVAAPAGGALVPLNALPAWATGGALPPALPAAAAAAAAAARAAHPHAVPTAGSGSTSTRDMLRSVFNRIKLLHPVAARLETPNSVSDLLSALARHFGPAMALTTDQLRGKDANDVLAALFSWARGQEVTPGEVERCFPLVPHGKVLMPYVLWDRIAELGLFPLHWQVPLVAEQVVSGQRDGQAGVPAPHAAPACRVAAPGATATALAPGSNNRKKARPSTGAVELPRSNSEPRPPRAVPRRQQTQDADIDYEPAPRPARRHSALAPPSRFALESSSGGSGGGGSMLQADFPVPPAAAAVGAVPAVVPPERAASPSLTPEDRKSVV